jgi:hypothetical protein
MEGLGRNKVKKSPISWDTTPYSPLKINRRFEGTRSLHLQGQRNNKPSKKPAAIPCYLLSLFFDTENGGEVFRRNV